MTIWETLFGTPERTARTLKEVGLDSMDHCYMMDAISDDRAIKCANCIYEYDPYGCESRDIDVVDWLNQEVTE